MSKHIQDAYIVAATRTPVAKRKGMFAQRPSGRHAGPRAASSVVAAGAAASTPSEIGDVIVGCAMPEAEQGMNVARIGLLLAGLPDTVPGITINRFCSSGVQAVAMAADRIRLGECRRHDRRRHRDDEHDVADDGQQGGDQPGHLRPDENLAIAYGMGLTAEKVAQQWKVTREDAGCLRRRVAPPRTARPSPPATSRPRSRPTRCASHLPDFATGKVKHPSRRTVRHRRRPASGYHHGIAGQAEAGVRRQGLGDGRQLLADVRRRRRGGAGVARRCSSSYNLTPLARFAGFAVAGVPPEIMGIGPIEAIPRVLASRPASRRTTSTGSNSTKPSPRSRWR